MVFIVSSCQNDTDQTIRVSIIHKHNGGGHIMQGYDESFVEGLHRFDGLEELRLTKENKDGIKMTKKTENSWEVEIIEKGKHYRFNITIDSKSDMKMILDLYFLDFEQFTTKYQIK